MGPAPSSPRPVDPMEDEHLSVYLDVLEQHRDQPFIRLTAYGVLDFLAAVTGGGVLRFERDGQPPDTATTETVQLSLRWEKRGVKSSGKFGMHADQRRA